MIRIPVPAIVLAFAAAPLFAPSTMAQTAPAPPQWTYKESTDAATGAKSATTMVRAEDGSGRLIVRCDTVGEAIVTVQYIPRPAVPAIEGGRQVRLLFDNAKAETSGWVFPGGGAYNDEAYGVFMTVSQIAGAKLISVTTQNATGEVIGSDFVGPGSDEIFRKVYATCGRDYALPVVAKPKN